jgi:hypothetical protein
LGFIIEVGVIGFDSPDLPSRVGSTITLLVTVEIAVGVGVGDEKLDKRLHPVNIRKDIKQKKDKEQRVCIFASLFLRNNVFEISNFVQPGKINFIEYKLPLSNCNY